MKVKTVSYERLETLPGYANHRAGITIAVDAHDTVAEVMKVARAWVERELAKEWAWENGQLPLTESTVDIPF